MVLFLQNSYIEAQVPSVIVFGGGDWDLRVEPQGGLLTLRREARDDGSLLSTTRGPGEVAVGTQKALTRRWLCQHPDLRRSAT